MRTVLDIEEERKRRTGYAIINMRDLIGRTF